MGKNLKKQKKGDVQQMFVYLITIIIAGTILLIGYKFIAGFMKDSKDAQMLDFEKTIQANAKSGIAYGSIETFTYNVPTEYTSACIIDLGIDFGGSGASGSLLCDQAQSNSLYEPIICDFWKDSSNVDKKEAALFLLPGPSEAIILERKVQFDGPDNFICPIITDGRLSLQMEGLGRSVIIRPFDENSN